jgi:hypothetical protein
MKRGVEPIVDSHPTGDSMPVDSSTRKMATLSCPRFDAWTNRPLGSNGYWCGCGLPHEPQLDVVPGGFGR